MVKTIVDVVSECRTHITDIFKEGLILNLNYKEHHELINTTFKTNSCDLQKKFEVYFHGQVGKFKPERIGPYNIESDAYDKLLLELNNIDSRYKISKIYNGYGVGSFQIHRSYPLTEKEQIDLELKAIREICGAPFSETYRLPVLKSKNS